MQWTHRVVQLGGQDGPQPSPRITCLHTNRNYRSWNDGSDIGSIIAMDLKEVVAVNLRRLRHANGMTQEELAERAGLSARYVGGVERADVSVSVTVLGRIADALGVEAVELVRVEAPNGRNRTATETVD